MEILPVIDGALTARRCCWPRKNRVLTWKAAIRPEKEADKHRLGERRTDELREKAGSVFYFHAVIEQRAIVSMNWLNAAHLEFLASQTLH